MVTNGPFTHGTTPTPIPEWRFNPLQSGGGALIDIGPHVIDLFRFFNGEAQVQHALLSHKFNLPIEDGAILILKSVNSSTKGIIHLGWYQKPTSQKYNFRVVLHGSAGFLSSEPRQNPYIFAMKEGIKNVGRRLVKRDIQPLSYTETLEAYYKEMKHFIDCLKTDTLPSVTTVDGLKTIEIIESVYKKMERIDL
jgi:predicted dehydrogenase